MGRSYATIQASLKSYGTQHDTIALQGNQNFGNFLRTSVPLPFQKNIVVLSVIFIVGVSECFGCMVAF